MKVTFFGGAGGVTGSKHLLETESGRKILLDCGTFQGLPDVRSRNLSFPFEPDTIDYVILSHAHIDHSGMLPLLVKRGFSGAIFSTSATASVAEYMLLDAASIEEQDASYQSRHKVGAPTWREPLFTQEDVAPVMEKFVAVPYARDQDTWHEIEPGLRLKFYDAGHILGSAMTVLEYDTSAGPRRLLYTGDIGPVNTPLLPDPEVPTESISAVIMESTYGGLTHNSLAATIDRLAAAINKVCQRGGKIIIPAFSLGRTQLLVYVLHKLTDEKKIPRLPIFVDSPLATNLTEVYRRHRQHYDLETWSDFAPRQKNNHAPLSFSNLTYTSSKAESQELNSKSGPFIVISASGMMTAGRVIHHLRHSIANERNAIFITGYQAQGTLGRRLLDGDKTVSLYGERFPVKAKVHIFNEFSAHADQRQLTEFVKKINGLKQLMLVHGEPEQAAVFRQQLSAVNPGWTVLSPNEGDTVELV